MTGVDTAIGFFLNCQTNDSFRAVNQLLKAGQEVKRLKEPFILKGEQQAAGTFFIPRQSATLPFLEKIARSLGTSFSGSPVVPDKGAVSLQPARLGLWDKHGGSIPSGWTRWLLEQFEFPYRVVQTDELEEGNLRGQFDVLVLVEGAMVKSAAPELQAFLHMGGTVIAIGSATNLTAQLELPISNHLVSGDGKALPREKFYVPPSLLRVDVDQAQPLAWGMPKQVDVLFANSPTFRLAPDADEKAVKRVAWFASPTPLRSGWAWGQQYLEGGVAIAEARIGQGRLLLFGPQILFRAQPHGTFKFFFNAIAQAGTKE